MAVDIQDNVRAVDLICNRALADQTARLNLLGDGPGDVGCRDTSRH
jgi:hypothetical protein